MIVDSMGRLPQDIVARIRADFPVKATRASVEASLERLQDETLNVGPLQLARAILVIADGDYSEFLELRRTFRGDPRDVLMEANAVRGDRRYWFTEPFEDDESQTEE